MTKMNIKQRVFVDIATQVPFGSNKMAHIDNVSGAYADELEAIPEEMEWAIAKCKEEASESYPYDEWPDYLKTWSASCKLINKASKEVREAKEWLVKEGYLRVWEKKVRFGTQVYHGLTAKGWKFAARYIEMAKAAKC